MESCPATQEDCLDFHPSSLGLQGNHVPSGLFNTKSVLRILCPLNVFIKLEVNASLSFNSGNTLVHCSALAQPWPTGALTDCLLESLGTTGT